MKEITADEYQKEVLEGGKVALDFYSTECPPCDAVAPKFENLAELYGDDIKFLKIFRQGNKELANKLEVKSSPTVLFFENGKEIGERQIGGIKRSDLMTNLDLLVSETKAKEIRSKIKPISTEVDVAILGAGPSGLTAGLYLCQSKINTVMIDIGQPGGQVSTTHKVSNYPGFIQPIAGFMLSHNMSEQTKICGTKFKVSIDITKVDLDKKEIIIDDLETIKAKKIIIATGASPNLINIQGEKELKGRGISYCATCDAKYYDNKEVIVIGGGNSAIEEAEFISKFASKVTIVHQFDKLQANKVAQEKAFANPKLNFVLETEPRKFEKSGDKMLVTVEDLKTKTTKVLETDGVFIFIGMKPNIELFNGKLELDQWGYLKTNEDRQTSMKDIYAAGDVISKKYRQITTAVSDGTIAAIAIAREFD